MTNQAVCTYMVITDVAVHVCTRSMPNDPSPANLIVEYHVVHLTRHLKRGYISKKKQKKNKQLNMDYQDHRNNLLRASNFKVPGLESDLNQDHNTRDNNRIRTIPLVYEGTTHVIGLYRSHTQDTDTGRV